MLKAREQSCYVIKEKGYRCFIDLKSIKYFVSDLRTVTAYLSNGERYTFYKKMDKLYEEVNAIDSIFLRINRSYIVNVNYIIKYSGKSVVFDNIETRINKQYKTGVIDKLISLEVKR